MPSEIPPAMLSAGARAVPCTHIAPGQSPFKLIWVLDDAAGPTDAVAQCRHCNEHWLLEMLDWRQHERLMRIAPLDATSVRELVANLERGSCDVRRAGAELAAVLSGVTPLRCLVAIDARDLAVTRLLWLPAEMKLPSASWRSLPCDGRWFDLATLNP